MNKVIIFINNIEFEGSTNGVQIFNGTVLYIIWTINEKIQTSNAHKPNVEKIILKTYLVLLNFVFNGNITTISLSKAKKTSIRGESKLKFKKIPIRRKHITLDFHCNSKRIKLSF